MSIRLKLILSYLTMLIVPVFLSMIAAVVILVINIGSLRHYGSLGPDFFEEMTNRAASVYKQVEHTAQTEPDKLKDKAYLDELDKKLVVLNSNIAVKSREQVIYQSKFLESKDFFEDLSQRSSDNERMHGPIVTMDKKPYSVMEYNFYFSDKSPGKIYLVTDISPIGRFAVTYFRQLTYFVLFILVLTNGLLTYFVSRSIIRPLNELKKGTVHIKEGNLNFQISCKSKDEIGELCFAFEEMRSKLKQSIDTQLQYEENRKELISNISHDLKTPITSIKGYVEGIMDGVADTPEKMERYIKTIYTKAADMDKLIEDLFLFSKLDLKKLPFNFEQVALKKYFEDCKEELQMDMDKRGIKLSFSADIGDTVNIIADREKLKRVIMNITDNSAKYMDKEQGQIDIALTADAENATVVIRDNGQGISKESLDYIFERFYRADASRNTATGGTGLGLAIAKQIIEGHGGRIWAESEPGQGTVIYFTLKRSS